MSLRTVLLVSAALALPSAALATPATNGKFLNTDALNGKFLNGTSANGKFLNTALLDSTSVGGATSTAPFKAGAWLMDTHVAGSGLAGWALDWSEDWGSTSWAWRTGTWFEGAELSGKVVDQAGGEPELVTLHIDRITAAEPGSDVLLHWVSVMTTDETGGAVTFPLCGWDQAQREIPAIVLRGEWSQDERVSWGGDQISDSAYRVTFACASGALGKCAADCASDATCAASGVAVALGYRRWAAPHTVSTTDGAYRWRDYAMDHQSCTRMVRADYCGDGVSWTANGTEIDVYDKTEINVTSSDPYGAWWQWEATWNENGATRISCDRLQAGPVTCDGAAAPSLAGFPARATEVSFGGLTTTHAPACYWTDGLEEPAARLGNLRRRVTAVRAMPTFASDRE